jgi:hypothetical protein
VFGIAIGGAFKEIQGSLAHLPAERAGDEEAAPAAEGTDAGDAEDSGMTDELAARRARRRAG